MAEAGATTWWGPFQIPVNTQGRWRIGPLSLWIQHAANEWRVAHELLEDSPDHPVEMALSGRPEPLPETASLNRFVFSRGIDTLRLQPTLPDRSVVTKPDKPLSVFPGEQATLYISFPLWVRVEAGEPARVLQ